MPRGISIHLAVPRPQGTCCVQYALERSIDAAWKMAEIARATGFSVREPLIGAQVTADVVEAVLRGAACELVNGDVLLVTFAGHGCRDVVSAAGQVARFTESWCLADRRVYDTDLFAMWPAFHPGVRIILVSDSCFSGTIGGDKDLITAEGWERWRERRDALQAEVTRQWGLDADCSKQVVPITATGAAIRASVLILAASPENEPAVDGLFTITLRQVWERGAFSNYCELMARIRSALFGQQLPSMSFLGKPFPEFLRQKPFTIEPPV